MSDHDLSDLPPDIEVEIEPGLVVRRRSFLALSSVVIGGMAMPVLPTRVDAPEIGPTELTLAQFFTLANPLAKELVTDTSPLGQDRYLHSLAALAVRLVDVPLPEMRPQAGVGHSIGMNAGGEPFTVLHWRLTPGAMIGDHAHTYGNVMTLLLDGEVAIRNFEVIGERDYDAKGTIRVRKTCDQVLRPGGTNLVNLDRNYTHGFRAGPQGARGLDITTRIRDKRPTPLLELASKPVDEAFGIWEASWKQGT